MHNKQEHHVSLKLYQTKTGQIILQCIEISPIELYGKAVRVLCTGVKHLLPISVLGATFKAQQYV